MFGHRLNPPSPTYLPLVFGWVLLLTSLLPALLNGKERLNGEDGATLKGRIVPPAKFASQIQPDDLEIVLIEQVQTDDPPIPENWPELTLEEQDQWLAEFEASDAGKKYIAEQEAKIAAARRFPLKLEPDGKFAVYDVPPAIYAFSGRAEKSIEARNYLCEVFGQIEVLPEAQEILLGDLEISVSPIFKAGDPAPQIEVESLGKQKLRIKDYRGKFLLVHFWSTSSPPAVNFQKSLQKIVSELPADPPVELLALSIDADQAALEEFIRENGQTGEFALLGGWSHPAISEFGLHAIPALWLVDREGKFLATDSELGIALRESGLGLAEVLQYKLQGKELPKRSNDSSDQTP